MKWRHLETLQPSTKSLRSRRQAVFKQNAVLVKNGFARVICTILLAGLGLNIAMELPPGADLKMPRFAAGPTKYMKAEEAWRAEGIFYK